MRDVNLAALWDARDYPFVKKLFDKIRVAEELGHNDKVHELIETGWEGKVNRMLEGQYVPDTPENPKPLEVSRKNDVITNQGMGRIVSILVGKTNTRFTHYADGDGIAIATIGDTQLSHERFRIAMTTDGFMTAAGTVARYGAVMIPSAPSHTVSESGVVDTATGGTFLNRTLYPASQRIVHTIFEDFYSLSIALYLSSI
jgi:hypothetical protein